MQGNAELLEQQSGMSWTLYIMWTQNFGFLPICVLIEVTQFHLNESETPPGEHDRSPVLEGTT
jgi:hypothetical protein